MKILNKKKYKFQCRKCDTEILFSKEDCWVDRTYEDLWLTCPVCGRRHDNQTYGLFRQEYIEEYDEKDKEIKRLTTELESVNKSITWWQNRFNAVERDNERLNNIINNIYIKCKYLLENEKVIINKKTYYKQKCDDIITNFIYEELKGSDKK